ncbi:MAG: vWA domain-containing protein [Candidatus Hydrogenedentota bacterium]
MNRQWHLLGVGAAALSLLVLSGCPLGPGLEVTPRAVDFGTTRTQEDLALFNPGIFAQAWEVEEVVRDNPDAAWVAGDVSWLSAEPQQGSVGNEITHVQLTATRAGQSVGLLNNAGVRIVTRTGSTVVPVALRIEPTLIATPDQFSLAPSVTSQSFTVRNEGAQSANYEISLLADPADTETQEPLPDTMSATPSRGELGPGADRTVTVEWEEGQESFHLLVGSSRGNTVISFNIGAVLEGFDIAPSPITLYLEQREGADDELIPVVTPLRLENTGTASRNYTVAVRDRQDPDASPPIDVAPNSGVAPAGDTATVEVSVNDPAAIDVSEMGSGRFDLLINADDAFEVVPVIIEVLPLPEITLSAPPDPANQSAIEPLSELDFGREAVQQTFYIANTGIPGSRLFYRITFDGQDDTESLIVGVTPIDGSAAAEHDVFFVSAIDRFVDATPVQVTIDRSQMQENIENRTLTVTPYDQELENPLAVVDPVDLTLRVERPPLSIEGAINRARPPFIERFVLLLRDTLGEVIPTREPEDLEAVKFIVFEDEQQLDPQETNQFVSLPDDLKVNLAILLDFTGSMYLAGTRAEQNPLAEGEAITLMKDATAHFLDDLPPSYRVALLYFNDRQQENRLIHQFSTDRDSLKAALDAFSVPPGQHGVSDVFDALTDTMDVIDDQDAGDILPFDDADLRAVIYMTDGIDNASINDANQVSDLAQDRRCRLYPVVYSANGAPVNYADMMQLAADTGGRLYSAENVNDLTQLLGSEAGLVLEPAATEQPNFAMFNVRNLGTEPLFWRSRVQSGNTWIRSIDPTSASVSPGSVSEVAIELDPSAAPVGERVESTIEITSPAGDAAVAVQMTPAMAGNMLQAQDIDVNLNDTPGEIWRELQNQVVFTYITPKQDSFSYRLNVTYEPAGGAPVQGEFERDATFYPGDIRAGQLAMTTTGITENLATVEPAPNYSAEAFVRTDYVPRNVNRFRLRFFLVPPEDAPAAAVTALDNVEFRVELAPNGLLTDEGGAADDWRLISEGDGSYQMLTETENFLPYGAFGNLLRIAFDDLDDYVNAFPAGVEPELLLEMRCDNQIYVAPASAGEVNDSKYFLYPSGPTFPNRPLSIALEDADFAPPARELEALSNPGIEPQAEGAWDQDLDGLPDFNDPGITDDNQPGTLAVPNTLQIAGDEAAGQLTIRNNRLDTFTWTLNDTPSWIVDITYGEEGDEAPRNTLSPGESQVVNLIPDRGLLSPGFVSDELILATDMFPYESITVILLVDEQ